jgi:hypothetical protein
MTALKPRLKFIKLWSDEDIVTLRVEICDGASLFVTNIYAGHQRLRDTALELDQFKSQIDGSMFNLRFGEFGCEYASGAVDARFHFRSRGKLLITVAAESEFRKVQDREIASKARLFLVSEPALLDEFVQALSALSQGYSAEAELGAMHWF